ncbi:hypothetical protein BDR26DRAFT_856498 [Obelidium mucronatum]|nr:hypothetical protein BDR26DRAFT_856498 [Obelidium mucronatum]
MTITIEHVTALRRQYRLDMEEKVDALSDWILAMRAEIEKLTLKFETLKDSHQTRPNQSNNAQAANNMNNAVMECMMMAQAARNNKMLETLRQDMMKKMKNDPPGYCYCHANDEENDDDDANKSPNDSSQEYFDCPNMFLNTSSDERREVSPNEGNQEHLLPSTSPSTFTRVSRFALSASRNILPSPIHSIVSLASSVVLGVREVAPVRVVPVVKTSPASSTEKQEAVKKSIEPAVVKNEPVERSEVPALNANSSYDTLFSDSSDDEKEEKQESSAAANQKESSSSGSATTLPCIRDLESQAQPASSIKAIQNKTAFGQMMDAAHDLCFWQAVPEPALLKTTNNNKCNSTRIAPTNTPATTSTPTSLASLPPKILTQILMLTVKPMETGCGANLSSWNHSRKLLWQLQNTAKFHEKGDINAKRIPNPHLRYQRRLDVRIKDVKSLNAKHSVAGNAVLELDPVSTDYTSKCQYYRPKEGDSGSILISSAFDARKVVIGGGDVCHQAAAALQLTIDCYRRNAAAMSVNLVDDVPRCAHVDLPWGEGSGEKVEAKKGVDIAFTVRRDMKKTILANPRYWKKGVVASWMGYVEEYLESLCGMEGKVGTSEEERVELFDKWAKGQKYGTVTVVYKMTVTQVTVPTERLFGGFSFP